MAYIRCDNCRIEMTGYMSSMDFLIDKWNQRLRPCPFCNNPPKVLTNGHCHCHCLNCPIVDVEMSVTAWEVRPSGETTV